MEFLKFSCSTQGCWFCAAHPWRNEPIKRVPEPYPNNESGSYLHVSETPIMVNGKIRDIDDYNPRTQLRLLFEDGAISVGNDDEIKGFAHKYIVDKDMVFSSLKEMKAAKVLRQSKAKARLSRKQEEERKAYGDYDWKKLVEEVGLKKLTVNTLDKYISHHSLKHLRSLNKSQKVEGIRLHYMRNMLESHDEETSVDAEDSDLDSGSSDDEVLTCRENIEDDFEDPSLFTTNRYGRTVGVLHDTSHI